MTWNSGYIAEIDYTHGYYAEISPNLIDYCLLLRGIAPPDRSGKMTYLELGFGQGLATNIHAAATDGEFWGTDMNPAHAANARQIATASGNQVKFFDQTFEEFAKRDDLPEFDYITMHGIWSWVSDDTRNAICDIIKSKLKVGGVFYVSYNALPGWAPIMPLRHLLSLYSDHGVGDAQGIMARVEASLGFAKSVSTAQARYFTVNPTAAGRLEGILGQDRQYVAHEYFNRHWTPKYFSEVDAKLNEAKVTFAGSATILEHLDALNLTAEQQDILNQLAPGTLRESLRDYMVNQQFRRDLFVRGARRLGEYELVERLRSLAFVPIAARERFPERVTTGLGELQLRPEIYGPLADALFLNGQSPKTMEELSKLPCFESLPFSSVIEAISLLIGVGCVYPVQSEHGAQGAIERAQRLTAHILQQSRLSAHLGSLPSPLTGTGISVSRFEQLFLAERAKGVEDPAQWAAAVWAILEAQSQRIVKDSNVIESSEDNLAELVRQANAFQESRLPILLNLGIGI
jgi:Predicted methyltransferase regulatory domain/Methyltransferase domain